MRQSANQDNPAGQQYTPATFCPAAQHQHGIARGAGGSSSSSSSAVFYGLPSFYSVPGAAFGPACSASACTNTVWGQFSSLSVSTRSSSGGGAQSIHSSSGGGSHIAHPAGGASFSTAGWPTASQTGQYFGYAAVPCIMVPTGDPVFYTHVPTHHGTEHMALHPTSNGGIADGGHQLQLAAPSTSYAQQSQHHSSYQQHHQRWGRKQRHTSQQHSMDSLYGTHSRSVSSFSSMAGFYAIMDSSSDTSQQDAGQQDDPYGLRARAASGAETATSWGHLTVGILQHIINKLVDAEVKQLRGVCRHWRAAVDQNLDTLTPSSLMSKLITLRFPNLKLLHLTNCSNVRNRDLQLLSNGGLRLHTLTLGDDANRPWVSNIGLAWIGKVTTLTALNLQDCTQLTNRGLLPLQQLTGLAALSLKGCNKLNNMGLEGLRHNTALTSLNLTGCARVSDKGLLPLTALPSLLSLHLGGTRVKDEGMEYLARITTLHDLHFAREAITDAGIMQLSTLTNLQTLALRECPQVTGDSLSALVPKLSNLQSLDLFQSYDFDDAQLAKCLDFIGSVTFLDLRGTVVSEEGIQQLARLQNLQKLCLAPKTEIRVEQHLCVVSHLTQLTSLAINNCRLVSFDLMASLAHLKLLRELDISNNGQTAARASDVTVAREPVNDGAIRAMTNITSLTSIDLSRRFVHEEQLNVLAEHLPKLRTLFVVGCPVLYETLQSLHRRFPELVIHRKPLHDPPPLSCSSSEHGFI